MIHSLAAFCYVAFLFLALLSPFLPVFLMWRVAGLSTAAYATGKLFEGPVHWSDKNLAHVIGVAIILLFCCAVALAIIIRLAVSGVRKTLNVDAMIGPKNRFMYCFDVTALSAVGCCVGLALTISLAYVLSGVSVSVNVDVGVAVLAMSIAVVVLVLSREKVAITLASIFVTLAVCAIVGAKQPNRIITTAKELADGHAWCLTTSGGSAPVIGVQQLGFFTLPKKDSYPHLGLLKRDNDGTTLIAHWSIRQQRFVQNTNMSWSVPTCHPTENFVEALKNGKVEKTIFGVGFHVYSIGREFNPRAYTDRVSIRSGQLTGSASTHPSITEIVELIYNPREPNVPEDAISLAMMPDPDELNAHDLTGRNRLIVEGLDDTTKQRLILYCLAGPYVEGVCFAQVFEGLLGYTFYLPLSEIDRWREAADRVKSLFESLRINPRR